MEMSRVDTLIRNDKYTDIVSMKRIGITDTFNFLGPRIDRF